MSGTALPMHCDCTVATLVAEHPVVVPILERYGIPTDRWTDRPLVEAAHVARVAGHTLCEALEATIAAGRLAS